MPGKIVSVAIKWEHWNTTHHAHMPQIFQIKIKLGYSQSLLYGHLLNTGTSSLQTVYFVPGKNALTLSLNSTHLIQTPHSNGQFLWSPQCPYWQGLTVTIMRPMTPYLSWAKFWGGRGITRKERGLPPCCPWLQEICKHGYKFQILKSFYNTKKIW